MGPSAAIASGLRRRLVIPSEVVFRDLDDEAVLLNLHTGVYFGLDPVATRIWHLLRQHGRLADVRDAMLQEYEVSSTTLTADLIRFADDLLAHGLVEPARG